MTTFLLIRHAVNDFVKSGRLAGRSAGVHLNAEGRAQAQALAARLADAPLQQIHSSPLLRTLETARAIQKSHPQLVIQRNAAINEIHYGHWQGAKIIDLTHRKLWRVIQQTPSRAQFPGGESLRAAQARAVDELERLRLTHPRQWIALVSHADIIRLVVAHFLGMHLDQYQRLFVAPASLTMLEIASGRPTLLTWNDCAHLKTQKPTGS